MYWTLSGLDLESQVSHECSSLEKMITWVKTWESFYAVKFHLTFCCAFWGLIFILCSSKLINLFRGTSSIRNQNFWAFSLTFRNSKISNSCDRYHWDIPWLYVITYQYVEFYLFCLRLASIVLHVLTSDSKAWCNWTLLCGPPGRTLISPSRKTYSSFEYSSARHGTEYSQPNLWWDFIVLRCVECLVFVNWFSRDLVWPWRRLEFWLGGTRDGVSFWVSINRFLILFNVLCVTAWTWMSFIIMWQWSRAMDLVEDILNVLLLQA